MDGPEKQTDLRHIRTKPDQLTPAAIVSILSIKTVWSTRPEYGKQVTSLCKTDIMEQIEIFRGAI